MTCSPVNGCVKCPPKLFLFLRRERMRQYGECLHDCPAGYYGMRGPEFNMCSSKTSVPLLTQLWSHSTFPPSIGALHARLFNIPVFPQHPQIYCKLSRRDTYLNLNGLSAHTAGCSLWTSLCGWTHVSHFLFFFTLLYTCITEHPVTLYLSDSLTSRCKCDQYVHSMQL